MPANSLTVRLIIDIREGKATRAVTRVDRKLRGLTGTMRRLIRRGFRPIRRWISIMSKALLSMVAVLIAFNIFLTAPQRAFQALITLIKATVSTLSDFEQRILALQGILASTVIFLQDPVENFRNAGLVATGVVEELALRANEMVVSLSEATVVFQTLLATGAAQSIRDVDKIIDLTILLSNSIAGVTVGQDRQRQLAEETRSLFTKQLRANALLNNILFRNRQEMREFFRQAEASDTVVEQLAERLTGFSQVALALGRTLEGIKTTALTLLQVIARRAFGGILVDFENRASAVFEQIVSDTMRLNNLAAFLGAAVTVILNAILGIIQRIFGITFRETTNILDLITDAIPLVTKGFLSILFAGERIVKILIGAGSILDILLVILLDVYDLVRFILQLIFRGVELVFRLIAELARKLGFLGIKLTEGLQSGLKGFNDELARLGEVTRFDRIRANLKRVTEIFAGFVLGPTIEDQVEQAFGSGFFAEHLSNLARIVASQKEQEAALRDIVSARRIDLTTNIQITDELLKQSRALRSQISSVKEVLRLALRGGVDRGISNLLGRNILELEEQARDTIGKLVAQLNTNRVALERARTPGVIADETQIKKLEQQQMQIQGEIAATAADLIGLTALFAEFGRTTTAVLGRLAADLILGGVFKNLFIALTSDAAQLKSLFDGVIGSIKDFITSAEGQIAILGAIGNALAGAIKAALSGSESFGQSLKRLLGDLLIAIGQALIVAGSVSVLFGLLTLNGQMIASGIIAIAIGTGAIAAGLALGGGGGVQSSPSSGGGGGAAGSGVREFSFDEALINVQQATSNLNAATENLESVAGSFSGVAPGQVVMRGLSEEGGATRVLSRDVQSGRNLTAAAAAGRVLQGRT